MEELQALAVVSASAGTFWALYTGIKNLANTSLRVRENEDRVVVVADVACKAVSSAFATFAALVGLWLLRSEASYRPSSRTAPSQFTMYVAVAYFLYDFFAMFDVYKAALRSSSSEVREKTWSGDPGTSQGPLLVVLLDLVGFVRHNPIMVAHHLLLSFVCIPLVICCRDHEPGDLMVACALLMEASTPFVSMRAILHKLDLKDSTLYVLNGLVMVVVFFCCRILIYPAFLHVYGVDRGGLTVLGVWRSIPARCQFWMVLSLLPQLYWFRVMLRGALKIVRKRGHAKAERDDLRSKVE